MGLWGGRMRFSVMKDGKSMACLPPHFPPGSWQTLPVNHCTCSFRVLFDTELWAAPPWEGLSVCSSGRSGVTSLTCVTSILESSGVTETSCYAALVCISWEDYKPTHRNVKNLKRQSQRGWWPDEAMARGLGFLWCCCLSPQGHPGRLPGGGDVPVGQLSHLC